MFKTLTDFIRGIVWICIAILVVIVLANFAPGLFWGLVGIIVMPISYAMPIIVFLLFVRSWKLSKKIGIKGFKPRAKFMIFRAFQDVFRRTYIRMVHGDTENSPQLTTVQRLRLLRYDGAISKKDFEEAMATARSKRRTGATKSTASTTTTKAQPETVQEAETPRTAPRANTMARQTVTQPPAAPAKEERAEAPADDDLLTEEAPAPEPQQNPAPRPAQRPARPISDQPAAQQRGLNRSGTLPTFPTGSFTIRMPANKDDSTS